MIVQHIKPNRIIGHFTRAGPSGARFAFCAAIALSKPSVSTERPFLTQRVLRQVKREAKCIVKFKGCCYPEERPPGAGP